MACAYVAANSQGLLRKNSSELEYHRRHAANWESPGSLRDGTYSPALPGSLPRLFVASAPRIGSKVLRKRHSAAVGQLISKTLRLFAVSRTLQYGKPRKATWAQKCFLVTLPTSGRARCPGRCGLGDGCADAILSGLWNALQGLTDRVSGRIPAVGQDRIERQGLLLKP
ncbi:hypothetical protein BKA81DRAFT_369647 [Phyllosticta paracitricarpa]